MPAPRRFRQVRQHGNGDRIPEEAVGEEGMLGDGLERLIDGLDDEPEAALDKLVELRSSFVVPVPGILAERLGRGIVLVG